MRYQPRNKRWAKSQETTRFDERIQRAVERDAIRWGCSKSWVTACALAAFYDIDIMQPYEIKLIKGKKKKVA